jgi:hypothetical protein
MSIPSSDGLVKGVVDLCRSVESKMRGRLREQLALVMFWVRRVFLPLHRKALGAAAQLAAVDLAMLLQCKRRYPPLLLSWRNVTSVVDRGASMHDDARAAHR